MSSSSEKPLVERVERDTDQWISIREQRVVQALESDDITSLREISALPGGFGSDSMRRRVWPVLLRTERFFSNNNQGSSSSSSLSSKAEEILVLPTETKEVISDESEKMRESKSSNGSLPPHKDENQVKLDTRRSFVTYPRGLRGDNKLRLQEELNDLIVGVLRRYPTLHYFQGYHDILSVLYLTFIPPDLTKSDSRSRSSSRSRRTRKKDDADTASSLAGKEPPQSILPNDSQNDAPPPYESIRHDTEEWRTLRQCAEAVSLNRVRDAMGTGMEGMMGLLRILKRILRAADPELSRFSALISPIPTLPFFALSWVLTLFSHDCDSLEPVQRMFDFLLARNPISAVYLAAAILIGKKPQLFAMATKLGPEYQDDPSLLHPLFVRLPPLYPDTPSAPDPPPLSDVPQSSNNREYDDEPNPYSPIKLSELFALADKLMFLYPWDGEDIRGGEIMGAGSVVLSYEDEMASIDNTWSPINALELIDKEVVKPGAGTADDDEDAEAEDIPEVIRRSRRKTLPLRWPRSKVGTTLAVGIVLFGVGMAMYGVKAGGNDASWGRWWTLVIRGWIGKEGRKVGEMTRTWMSMVDYIGKSLKDIL